MSRFHFLGLLISGLTVFMFNSCNNSESVSILSQENQLITIDLTDQAPAALQKNACLDFGIEVVRLKGKVRHFGLDIFQNPPQRKPFSGIPDVHVWIAEYPFTKLLNIRTNKDGIWEVLLVKPKNWNPNLSFAYQKDFYPSKVEKTVFPAGLPNDWNTTKIRSNIIKVGSKDIVDLAVQMPDELFLYYSKITFENTVSALTGISYNMSNIVVATIGKSWATIYDTRLPHGDPGAIASVKPSLSSPLQGPTYFDETVTPNPTIKQTSADGGVMFNSLAAGTYTFSAAKAPYAYQEITFTIDPTFNLYISSPPYSIQGNNSSEPGEW